MSGGRQDPAMIFFLSGTPPEITVLRVDRTRPTQADAQYSRLRECALSLAPATTARSEGISP